jgi:penicillin-binding protein 1A
VALDNRSGEVRAMVGGDNYDAAPFNLATQGQRQPGSSIKPFILAEALRQGISPNSVWSSRKLEIPVPGSKEIFTVNNYEGAYAGITTLARATTFSDNSVFAQVGIKVGTKKVAGLAREMGIRTPVSSNYAMTLGGLKQGVTPLDMAHAYQTFASRGELVYGSLSPGADNRRRQKAPGPVGIRKITHKQGDDWSPIELPDGSKAVNKRESRRILDEGVADQVGSLLQGVVQSGTGTRAQVPGVTVAGKTGTTEGYGDAWFVGWTPQFTVAVWVGYPDAFKPMETEFQGQPVAGGTFPASIFRTFVSAVAEPEEEEVTPSPQLPSTTTPATPAPTTPAPAAPAPEAPAPTDPEPAPAEPAPAPAEPAPEAPQGGVTAPESGGAEP